MRIFIALAAVLLTAAAPGRLTDADIRSFLSRQERAWNAGDVADWAAHFTPDARFTDQARSGREMVAYGTSTLPQARTQAQRFFSQSQVRESGQVQRIDIQPDGLTARVVIRKVSRIVTGGRVRLSCADSVQTLVRSDGRILSRGRTDTLYRCPR
ncbi:nuclear transport factor 2 family protein [Phenylobacterium sp.]|uniref:nuclear transport factor 2 family protein n=1 Tax=Phenylobacterium sp. TaxID=1871053 RepID=UPI002C20E3FD|nr:nuclear transport factor 2 family protein [Phenylobacterium sp.]HVI32287.1 nuclear transport factor 2 family protein [Phenylobacterium sp.]